MVGKGRSFQLFYSEQDWIHSDRAMLISDFQVNREVNLNSDANYYEAIVFLGVLEAELILR